MLIWIFFIFRPTMCWLFRQMILTTLFAVQYDTIKLVNFYCFIQRFLNNFWLSLNINIAFALLEPCDNTLYNDLKIGTLQQLATEFITLDFTHNYFLGPPISSFSRCTLPENGVEICYNKLFWILSMKNLTNLLILSIAVYIII